MIARKLIVQCSYSVIAVALLAVLLLGVYLTSRNDPRKIVQPHLVAAASEAETAMEKRIEAVRAAFARARQGAAPFAEDCLGWAGKWALLKDAVRVGEADAHKNHVAEAFARRVFSNDDLKAILENAITGYISDLRGIEARMLVNLHADVADSALATKLGDNFQSDELFRKGYDRLSMQLSNPLTVDAGVFLTSNAASWITMDVATPFALEILLSAAASLGADPSWASSGAGAVAGALAVGVVVGVIADYIIAAVLKLAGYDPEAKIAATVCSSLDTLEEAICGQTGLRKELLRICRERAAVREKVVFALLLDGDGK